MGQGSVFVRLVLLMLATGASLVLLVTVFFRLTVNRDFATAVHRLIKDHAALVAASAPDLEAARRVRDRLGYDIRYQGPAGSWTTSEDLPSLEEARRWAERRTALFGGAPVLRAGSYELVPAADGGWYLFSWSTGRWLNAVHLELLALLALFVLTVLLAAYAVLRHLMRPLRLLGDGVARLGAGELEVVVPVRSKDEFGTLTAAFNRMVRRVREMIQARDQLLLDVSHELRSPLTRLKVALALPPAEGQRAGMAEDVAEMESMVGELLELERLRDGRGLRLEPRDLVAIARLVVASFSARGPGARLVTAAPAIFLELDADKLSTVLRNLLDNACKYSPPESRPVEVALDAEAGAIALRVSDHGPGIPAVDLPMLFEPFFRVDRSRSRRTGGYGLGLSICKRIVEAHGGTLAVEQTGPGGTTFLILLPMPPRAPGGGVGSPSE